MCEYVTCLSPGPGVCSRSMLCSGTGAVLQSGSRKVWHVEPGDCSTVSVVGSTRWHYAGNCNGTHHCQCLCVWHCAQEGRKVRKLCGHWYKLLLAVCLRCLYLMKMSKQCAYVVFILWRWAAQGPVCPLRCSTLSENTSTICFLQNFKSLQVFVADILPSHPPPPPPPKRRKTADLFILSVSTKAKQNEKYGCNR